MSEEWGPWIEHDGSGVRMAGGYTVNMIPDGDGITPPAEFVADMWPGFLWRWRKVKKGWFSSELRRICDEPAYAPIIRYRIRRPKGMEVMDRILEQVRNDHERYTDA